MKWRQISLLSGAGALCLLFSIHGGVLSAGYIMVGLSPILLRTGAIYLTLGVVTYLLAPVTPRGALLGALCASGLAFLSGATAMYYDLALTPPPTGTPLTISRLVRYQAVAVFVTLPISAGYLSGVLVRADRQDMARAAVVGAMLVGLVGGSWLALSLGFASGFAQVLFLTGVVATAVLGLLPAAVMAGVKLIPESTLGGGE